MFHILNNQLYCEAVALAEIATAVQTPTYIYSQAEILNRAHSYLTAVPDDALVAFALKANNNPAILRLLGEAGLGADVTSGGELFLARHASISPEKIIFSGVGKRRDEIEMALDIGIRALHVESEMELHLIAEIASERQTVADIGVRVNPNIPAETHPYMSTGEQSHKFGVSPETAVSLLHFAQEHPFLNPVGIAAHIGSQIMTQPPFIASANFLVELAEELRTHGIALTYIDVGGGFGVDYQATQLPQDEDAQERPLNTAIQAFVTAVSQPIQQADFKVVMEPGRSLIAPAGVLLTQVVYTKKQGEKTFVIVDAGMSDLIRPTLYEAFHPVWPVQQPAEETTTETVTIVGPICETGDWLAKDRTLPSLNAGDLLAIGQTGAYGYAMSSNYNGRLRPPEVLVNEDHYHIIRRRQDYTHLLDGCQSP